MSALKVHITEIHHSNVPEWLHHDKRYIGLSPVARIMYEKLRKRYMLSVHTAKTKKKFVDTVGEVFCFYTVKEFMRTLGVSDKTVTRAKRELIKIGLIREVRQGRNLPNMYYLLEDTFYQSSSEPLKELRKPKQDKPLKKAESYKVRPNYKENNNLLNTNNCYKKNSFQANNIIDFKSYINEKESKQTLESRLLEIANKYYTKFTIGRWSKKQWTILINQFVLENKDRKDIKNIHAFVYGSLKNMAANHDEKQNKAIKEIEQPSNSVDINESINKIEEQLRKGNIQLNKNAIPSFDWNN